LYTSLGKFNKNSYNSIFGSGSSYYYTKDFNIIPIPTPIPGLPIITLEWWDNAGFEFQKGATSVLKLDETLMPEYYTDIEPLVLRHQFVGNLKNTKSPSIEQEVTPTKQINVLNSLWALRHRALDPIVLLSYHNSKRCHFLQ